MCSGAAPTTIRRCITLPSVTSRAWSSYCSRTPPTRRRALISTITRHRWRRPSGPAPARRLACSGNGGGNGCAGTVGKVVLALHLVQPRDSALEFESAVADDVNLRGRHLGRGD